MLTRKQLLRSARAVFARDGFEHSCIEEIAAKAGKTRGAFYDNFSGKEDVFFAIFEENLDRDMSELSSRIASLSTFERRVEALVDYLSGLTKALCRPSPTQAEAARRLVRIHALSRFNPGTRSAFACTAGRETEIAILRFACHLRIVGRFGSQSLFQSGEIRRQGACAFPESVLAPGPEWVPGNKQKRLRRGTFSRPARFIVIASNLSFLRRLGTAGTKDIAVVAR